MTEPDARDRVLPRPDVHRVGDGYSLAWDGRIWLATRAGDAFLYVNDQGVPVDPAGRVYYVLQLAVQRHIREKESRI